MPGGSISVKMSLYLTKSLRRTGECLSLRERHTTGATGESGGTLASVAGCSSCGSHDADGGVVAINAGKQPTDPSSMSGSGSSSRSVSWETMSLKPALT